MQELCYRPVPPCVEETQGCESQLPLHRDWGYPGGPWEGGCYTQKVHRATDWLFPGLATCKRWAAAWPRRAGCRVVGEVLVPTQRWMVLVLGVGVRKRVGRREIATLHLKEKEWEEAEKG